MTQGIAIIGVAGRFPGAPDTNTFWRNLCAGTESIRTFSREELRAAGLPRQMVDHPGFVPRGAVPEDPDAFDAAFFDMSPREAAVTDAQRRIFMECVWEALESAGYSPATFDGVAGVFAGSSTSGFSRPSNEAGAELGTARGFQELIGADKDYLSTQVAYKLDLRGPAVNVATACSTSLVAVHLACASLLAGECDLAVAGGVTLRPPGYVYEEGSVYSPDGRCRPFDARAAGTMFGSGCGVVILRRFEDCLEDGRDDVVALVRGSAINNDGAEKVGFTAPSVTGQAEVIADALAVADVEAGSIGYVEAHGTGTALGDPIEVTALTEAFRRDTAERGFCALGSVKSNVGHLEAAAGVTSLIKAALAVRSGQLPPSLHFERPNPEIDFESSPFYVNTELRPWGPDRGPRRAGVSSFGMGGTNCHVVLEQSPAVAAPRSASRQIYLLPVSARQGEALRELAGRYSAHLASHSEKPPRLVDVCHTAASGRSHFEHRLAVVGTSLDEMGAALADFSAGGRRAGTVSGQAKPGERVKVAFLFTGQGSQYPGMGHDLYRTEPAFREALDRVAALFDAELESPLMDVLFAADASPRAIDETAFTQPALFALEYALCELWRSRGVTPDVVLGHSIGELVAATVCEVFSLEDAVRLVAARGRLMQQLPEGGAMVSARTTEQRAVQAIVAQGGRVSIAAVNGPESVVLSGDAEAVRAVAEVLADAGVETKELVVSHAFHSPLTEPMLEAFHQVATSLAYRAPSKTLISNRTGAVAGRELCSAGYWRDHVRDTVRFGDSLGTLAGLGVSVGLEIGPHPVLSGLAAAALPDAGIGWLPSLRRGHDGVRTALESLGGLYTRGVGIDWRALTEGGRTVALPTYPFQRRRYPMAPPPVSPFAALGFEDGLYPLSGVAVPGPGEAHHRIAQVSREHQPYLADHEVFGRLVVPAAFHVAVVLASAAELWNSAELTLEEVEFGRALLLDEAVDLHVVLSPRNDGSAWRFEVATRARGGDGWITHTRGGLRPEAAAPRVSETLADASRTCDRDEPVAGFYQGLDDLEVVWGPSWRWTRQRRHDGDGVLARLEAADGSGSQVAPLHPALIDNAFACTVAEALEGAEPFLPFSIASLRWYGRRPESAWCRSYRRSEGAEDLARADLVLWDDAGLVVAEVDGFALKRAPRSRFLELAGTTSEAPFYRIAWRAVDQPETESQPRLEGTWVVLGDGAEALAERLGEAGADVELAWPAHDEVAGVVSTWSAPADNQDADLAAAASETARRGLEQLRTLLVDVEAAATLPPVWWVTAGAWPVSDEESSDPSQAVLWGLARTWRQEQPDWPLVLVDLEPGTGEPDRTDGLLRCLAEGPDESEVAVRGGRRFVARLARAEETEGARLRAPRSTESYRLESAEQGRLDRLCLAPAPRRSPEAGEVEVEVRAVGLNFRDVLNALGTYPGPAPPLGAELCGVVTALGDGVNDLAVGDVVFGLGPTSEPAFSRFATVDARLLVRKPDGLTDAQAAAVPVAFLTAWYALRDLARLEASERVLVHAAAGGVGMAAVQLARRWGAEVRATASRAKWEAVRSSGVEVVADSRSREFAEQVGAVDVVLNSLTGELVDAGLSLLGDGGRFVELGKADLRSAGDVSRDHPKVSYHSFDLADAGPERLRAMLRGVAEGLADGTLEPLPVTTFAFDEAESAFRLMARGGHVGKLVLEPAGPRIRPGTVLITGGLGALGRLTARWLASEHGVRHLVLLGRSEPDAEQLAAVEEIRELGAEVTLARGDVADRAGLEAVLEALPADRPLRGVIHAAMVLDDGVLPEQDAERLAKVMEPKVAGAWNLHELTRDLDLDFFVLFSSATSLLGSAGQGNYAAANAFLDALAAWRRASGLPGLALGWGPWARLGAAAALDAVQRERVLRQGFDFLEPDRGLELLGEALERPEARIGVLPLDPRRLSRSLGDHLPPVWRELLGRPRSAAGIVSGLEAELSTLAPDARCGRLHELVSSEVARVLSLPAAGSVPPDQPLSELGLDSLMAVELRNALTGAVSGRLPVTLVYDHPTVEAIAAYLEARLEPAAQAPKTGAAVSSSPPRPGGKEPIAVVGMACRFPGGVDDPESYWRLLAGGVDAITEVPAERWDAGAWYDPDPDAAGKMTTRWGGFLDGVDRFDPAFFAIAPREAAVMDPQQRLLLEVAWEALEHAGIAAADLEGTPAGVFLGICGSDYAGLVPSGEPSEDPGAYAGTGNSDSVAAGRLSYVLGLEGPTLAVNTACSSSLVSVHLACQSLRQGESDHALAGGVNLVLAPEGTVYFSRIKAMSPTGRCHTFAAGADGYVRGDGCGLVVLKRLADAERAGDRVLAVIRGSAVNHDGRSNGLTAPHGPSQEAVIRRALAEADVAPREVDFVECHGTGTELGDPIEVEALAAVYGEDRPAESLVRLGSVKSNIGHTEAAAGVAGLMKAVLALHHEEIPPSLHFTEPNPHIPWEELPVEVVSEPAPWHRDGRPRRCGVSSFGISGTNAHVLLEEAPAVDQEEEAAARDGRAHLLPLSAKNPQALRELVERYRGFLEGRPGARWPDVCTTAALGRSHFEHRLAVVSSGAEEAREALARLAADDAAFDRAMAQKRPKVVFVFPGQGSQWPGMGRRLLEEEPVFRAAVEACDAALSPWTGWSALERLRALDDAPQADDVVQPLLFTMAVSLSALWRSWGVEPAAVLGYSQGEIAAAYVAGALSLEDAARVVAERSRVIRERSQPGLMALVQLPEAEVAEALAAFGDRVSIAVLSSPRSNVVAGDAEAVEQLLLRWESAGVFCRRIKVAYASHCPHMEPLLDAIGESLQGLAPRPVSVPMLSTLTGDWLEGPELDAEYWCRNLRSTVRFHQAMSRLTDSGHRVFLEQSPHPLQVQAVLENLGESPGLAVGSLKRDSGGRDETLRSLGELYGYGVAPDWRAVSPPATRRLALPTYPFQRQRYWVTSQAGRSGFSLACDHPLLRSWCRMAGQGALFEGELSTSGQPYLADHRVLDRVVVPGAAVLEMALAAAEAYFGPGLHAVRDVALPAAAVLGERGPRRVQVLVRDEGEAEASFELYGQDASADPADPWSLHATGRLARDGASEPRPDDGLRERCRDERDPERLYDQLAELGLGYGPAFRALTHLRLGDGEALARVRLPEAARAPEDRHSLHPALLDGALHALAGLWEADGTFLPFEVRSYCVYRSNATEVDVHATLSPSGENAVAEVTLRDPAGQAVAELRGLRVKRVGEEAFEAMAAPGTAPRKDWFYRLAWRLLEEASGELPDFEGVWSVLGESAAAEAFARRLGEAGAEVSRSLPDDAKLAGIITFWDPETDDAAVAAERMAVRGLEQLLALPLLVEASPPLWWVTTGAVSVSAEAADERTLAAATLWGLARTWRQEQPDWPLALVDLEPGDAKAEGTEALLRTLADGPGEAETAVRGGRRFAARLVPAPRVDLDGPLRLEAADKGRLDQLRLVSEERREPASGEVEVEVRAAGLNFRDVMVAMGLVPHDTRPLGLECAGVVKRVGEGVDHLEVGDPVFGLAIGAFSRFVTVDARLLVKKPEALSDAQAASVPTVFLTAWYALRDLAGLREGERLLVHAAAGGVGMAAVQLARLWDAEVCATASRSKWETVRSLGVEHVGDSRSPDFAEQLRGEDGVGVDVVLNSLAGELVDAGLSLLGEGGRFIEMGKTDVREAEQVAAVHPGVSYRAFDLMEAGPEQIGEMLREVTDLLASGELEPLPLKSFPMAEAEAAFRTMAQARHVGKLVLVPPAAPRTDSPARPGTVLITGGLGALGLLTARWLVREHGVKHLLLLGRSTPRGDALAAVEELYGLGAKVTVASCDVADAEALKAVLEQIPAEVPLRGVIHAAMVLDDGVLRDQDAERFSKVMAPKVAGAWNLHRLCADQDLDFFVLFSSGTSLLGAAGQGNYAAANAFLDALALHRRALGLPAVALNWGPWARIGAAAAMDATLRTRLSRQGFEAIEPEQGLELLGEALRRSEARLGVLGLDRGRLARSLAGREVPSVLRELVKVRGAAAAGSARASELEQRLRRLGQGEHHAAVLEAVRRAVARVLAFESGADVPPKAPLRDLGLDSLTAVELRNAIAALVGRRLSATLAFDHPNAEAIARHLLRDVLELTREGSVSADAATAAAWDEPIAVVGMSCRFPGGARDPESFWRLLASGTDAITEIPAERWNVDDWYDPDPDAAGKIMTRWGGFLEEVDLFDPGFFGIAPREAVAMDPQQRLLLEVSWTALEDAGVAAEALEGGDTGVFVGCCGSEYGAAQMHTGAPADIDAYTLTGSAVSVIAGRLAYVLGLQGPAISVDTACSSSLVSVHLACQSLRSGESSLALAGGVNLVLLPTGVAAASRIRALSPTGRCRTFSAAADGFVRGEGCAMVVLKRLSEAERDGDRVLAVIRGSAVNQDGRSSGLTAPNGPAQESVVRQALRQAGAAPAEVGYVECHGTGTVLGDPIEVQALAAVLGDGREKDRPLYLGSVKSNIGHAEGAAGVAGLMKAILAIGHEELPPSLHFTEPNPHIPWEELPVKVVAEPTPWRRDGRPRLAGVSSFGISGTNAHVVIGEAPAAEREADAAPEDSRPCLLPLSAKTPEALRDLAESYGRYLDEHRHERLEDVCGSAASSRSHFEHRLAVVGSRVEDVRQALAQWEGAGAVLEAPKVVFVFPGQGSQWPGMGRQLLDQEPVFRTAVEACDAALSPWSGWSALERLRVLDDAPQADDVVQPLLFTMAVSLSALWRSWGIEPAAVLGYSQGEIAAAHVAGALSLEDAARVVAERSRVIRERSQPGLMALVQLPEAEVAEGLAEFEDRVSIAVLSSPRSTVVAGDVEAVEQLLSQWEAAGVFCRRIKVAYASHCPHMEPLLGAIGESLRGLAPRPMSVPMLSTVTGDWLEGPEMDAEYWCRNLRSTVRFHQAMSRLTGSGHRLFLEQSAHPLQVQSVLENLGESPGLAVGSLKRDSGGRDELLHSLGELYRGGVTPDWRAVSGPGVRHVALPTYPFQRQRYWVESWGEQRSDGDRGSAHPLLGKRTELAGGGSVFERELSLAEAPYVADHRLFDRAVVPAPVILETALAAADAHFGPGLHAVENVMLQEALVVPERGALRLQLTLSEEVGGVAPFALYSRATAGSGGEWTLHARGELRFEGAPEAPAARELAKLYGRCEEQLDPHQILAAGEAAGSRLGPACRAVAELRRGDGEALARVELPQALDREAPAPFGLHPVLAMGAVQALGATVDDGEPTAYVPFTVASYAVYGTGATEAWALVRGKAEEGSNELRTGDVLVLDAEGLPLAELRGLRLRHGDAAAMARSAAPVRRDWLYRLDWPVLRPAPPDPLPEGLWVLSGGSHRLTEAAEHWRRSGADVRICSDGESLAVVLSEAEEPIRAVVTLWEGSSEDASLAAAAGEAAVRGLEQQKALLRSEESIRSLPPIWWVTAGAQPATPVSAVDPATAVLWGQGRVWRQERWDWPLYLVDLDPETELTQSLDALAGLLGGDPGEDEMALRRGDLLAPRLARDTARPNAQRHGTSPALGDGSVLITGGLGALGLLSARWLVTEHGACHLVLLGRGAAQGEKLAAVEEIRALGARVTTVQCDVSDRSQLEAVLAELPEDQPLRAVIHAAVALDDGVIGEQTPERFGAAMAAKVDGAWNLHGLTEELDLDLFVTFSSSAALLGAPGLSSYAAANSFLDSLAAFRRARGLPAQSLILGPWDAGGVDAVQQASDRSRVTRLGFEYMSPAEGLAVVGEALRRDEPLLGVLPLDVRQLARAYAAQSVPSVLRDLVGGRRRNAASGGRDVVARLGRLPAVERREAVRALVWTEVVRVLALPSDAEVEARRPLLDLGLDSLTAVELCNRLSALVGRRLPATLAFDHPNVEEAAGFIDRRLFPEEVAVEPSPPASRLPVDDLDVEALSDGEMDQLLSDQLAELEDLLA